MGVPYTKTATSISLVIDFVSVVVPSTHVNFKQICEAAADPATDEATIKQLADVAEGLARASRGEITVQGGKLYWRGYEVNDSLSKIILAFYSGGEPEKAIPFERFMAKARNNPDPRAADGLYDWVVAGNLPITPDGDILAWKAVQADYYSMHSGPKGKLYHGIGSVVEEPRSTTDSNPDRTCSRGIHFASLEYLKGGSYASGGRRILAVAINPEDVVAFPRDYNLSKGRCCRLTVVGEVEHSRIAEFYPNNGLGAVYDGWKYTSAPVPMPVNPEYASGQKWLDDDGDAVFLTDVDGKLYARYAAEGTLYEVDRSDGEITNMGTFLERYVSDASLDVQRNSRGFATGQQWENRRGDTVTINSVTRDGNYSMNDTDGHVYTEAGRFNSATQVSQLDLVRLVKDVN